MNYNIVAIICITALIIGIFIVYENELFSKQYKRSLIILSCIIILEIILDTVSFSFDGVLSKYIYIYKINKILEFTIMPFIPTLLSYLISNKNFWNKIRYFFTIIICINFIFQVLTYFFPIMFFIDEKAVYHRTQYSYIYIFVLVICYLLLNISANNTFVQNTTKINGTLYAINVFLLIGIMMRTFYEKSNSDWLCITLSYFIFIIYFCNCNLKIDAITSLLNRKAFNMKLSQINYSTALIVIDVNKFKQVNDKYGHQNGDIALHIVSEAILKIYGNIGYCYRIGGDEFCVILKPYSIQKLTSEPKSFEINNVFEKLLSELDKEIDDITKKYPMLKYGVSQGYAIYYSSFDDNQVEKYRTIEDVLKMADENMYKKKNSKN